MITEKQKQKMLECLDCNNFCGGISCKDCPLWKSEHGMDNCLKEDLRKRVRDIEPEKKLCPTCGHELDKEIEE